MRFVRLIIILLLLLCAGGGPLLAEGGAAEALITPHIGTFVWTLLTFVLMLFILGRFAWKPLIGALNEREESIRESVDKARSDRDEAEAMLKHQEELLAQARRERAAALDAGRRDAENLKAEILQEAQAHREQMMKQTDEQVQAGLDQARAEFRGQAANLAIQAAEKLIRNSMDDATQRRLVEEYLLDLERSADSGNRPS
jgi:F-type H+-transporting ATPase subunit b